jgi:hypothetical protein
MEGRMQHRFHLHQLVRAKVLFFEKRRNGIHAIVCLLPPAPDGIPLYRIKNETEGTERVVGEYEIEAAPR